MEKIKIGITHGYTNGVGYEVILKAFEEPTLLEMCTPIVYGSPKVASYHRKSMGLTTNFATIQKAEDAQDGRLNLMECIQDEVKVELGQKTPEADNATTISIEAARRDYAEKCFDAQVMAPGDDIAESDGLTLLINERMKIAFVTDQQPMNEVGKNITEELLTAKLEALDKVLKRDFAISGPRIAVLALNPEPGHEEEEILKPVIAKASEKHILAMGPLSAESIFGTEAYSHYDAILALYHDQGYVPFKLLTSDFAVKLHISGDALTSAPVQDAELAKAGKGEANITSFCNAIYTVTDILRNRQDYDEAHANPLPKLFHDKREDNRRSAPAE